MTGVTTRSIFNSNWVTKSTTVHHLLQQIRYIDSSIHIYIRQHLPISYMDKKRIYPKIGQIPEAGLQPPFRFFPSRVNQPR